MTMIADDYAAIRSHMFGDDSFLPKKKAEPAPEMKAEPAPEPIRNWRIIGIDEVFAQAAVPVYRGIARDNCANRPLSEKAKKVWLTEDWEAAAPNSYPISTELKTALKAWRPMPGPQEEFFTSPIDVKFRG